VIVKGTLQNPDIFGRKWGYRADLTHIDGVIRVLAAGLDPETIRPKRAYAPNRYLAPNELSRLVLGALRATVSGPLSNDWRRSRTAADHGITAISPAITARQRRLGVTLKLRCRQRQLLHCPSLCAPVHLAPTLYHHN